ncbi:carbamoyltransferase C-terminal domain-containing protein [Labrenzia sp. DG1229]|uniref:carbamoyltransferase C-terminal domain-containing protein n=1 Tax=Labrenzia sp. DG1229 TaxID=681847 RepID=UPI000690D275|nr:carbamoyltransferase C-terminal domain-containing protein [Labrenzia sp. DG1229]
MAGGVFLNAIANHRILKETPFKRIFVQPAAHDAGTALGAAYLGWYRNKTSRTLPTRSPSPFLGRIYDDEEIEKTLVSAGTPYSRVEEPDYLTGCLIANGCIVARYDGRSEFGPRALGHRSILADCRDPDIKQRLDQCVKYREPYRPYAPAVRSEDYARYFELGAPSPYMLLIGSVRPEWRSRLPGITHADGSARVQTVDDFDDPGFARVIKAFHQITGIGVLLNTSMNIAGKPIVETPSDALKFLAATRVDCLMIQGFVAARTEQELNRILQMREKVSA